MTPFQNKQKRSFDFIFSFLGLLLLWWLILLAAFIAWLDTGLSGFFKQLRVGKNGKLFKVIKIRSMRPLIGVETSITSENDPRISRIGRIWRRTKIDELPQLWNVFIGNMSFVGPRPDVPGYADKLKGKDRIILNLRPGITGAASLYFKDEEILLAKEKNPEKFNNTVIWPQKIFINLKYLEEYSLWKDIRIIIITITGLRYNKFKDKIRIQIE